MWQVPVALGLRLGTWLFLPDLGQWRWEGEGLGGFPISSSVAIYLWVPGTCGPRRGAFGERVSSSDSLSSLSQFLDVGVAQWDCLQALPSAFKKCVCVCV